MPSIAYRDKLPLTFPAHKHVGNFLVEAEPPDLNDVLAEIDGIVYCDS